MRKIAFSILGFLIFAVAGIICPESVCADSLPSISVRLRLVDEKDNPTTKNVYRLGKDVVRFAIYQQNVGKTSIIASEKYVRKDFYLNLHLYVTGADGKERLVTAKYPEGIAEPPPPLVKLVGNQLVSVEPVEILPGGWVWRVTFDGPDYYNLVAGKYSARVVIPVTTYNAKALLRFDGKPYARIDDPSKYIDTYDPVKSIHPVAFSIIADKDDDGWYFPAPDEKIAADCDDTNNHVNPGVKNEIPGNGLDDDCNDATADKPSIQNKTLIVHSVIYKVGSGSRPPVKKKPYNGVEVRVFDYTRTSCCQQKFGPTWHYYESIWKSSELGDCCPMQAAGITGYKGSGGDGKQGAVTFSLPPGNYLVLGKPKNDNVYTGAPTVVLESGRVIEKYLPYIAKADGTECPGKYAAVSGPGPLIVEPEFVEWDGAQEYYPVIFDAKEDWVVTTSLKPPEGFAADYDSLSQKVNNETKAVQFMLTEKGAHWKEAKLEHVIQQKGKTNKVSSKIDVKLTEQLAKEKGISVYGIAGDPWGKKKRE